MMDACPGISTRGGPAAEIEHLISSFYSTVTNGGGRWILGVDPSPAASGLPALWPG